MRQIGLRLVQRGEGVKDRCRAPAQSRDLRKDEPHPVALFPTGPKLRADPRVDGRLRFDKALQVKAVGHDRPSLCPALTPPPENPPRAPLPRPPPLPSARP